MHRAAITHHLPVNAPLSHLILKGSDMLRRNKGIVSPMQGKHLRLDLFGVFRSGRSRCIEAAVEAYHPCDIRAASGKLEDRRPSEAVTDGRDLLHICQFMIL